MLSSDASPILFLAGWSSYSHYEGPGEYSHKILIKVANMGYQKSVGVLHSNGYDSCFIPAQYVRAAEPGWEIWSVDSFEFKSRNLYHGMFAVYCEVNGQMFWDNHEGMNYFMDEMDGALFADNLIVFLNSAYYSEYLGYTSLSGSVIVKNLAQIKKVEIVYTVDNWQSQSVAEGEFCPLYQTGAHDMLRSPNWHNTEIWTFKASGFPPVGMLMFYIRYTVNGAIYYDNNFRNNYLLYDKSGISNF